MVLAEDILNTARMFLNDQNIQLWNDTVLMPMLQRAHNELQVILRQRAAPIMKTHMSGYVDIGDTSFPTIPDISSPIFIQEADYPGPGALMTEADPLPLLPIGPALNWWYWDGQDIQFAGATTQRFLLIWYWRKLPLPTQPSDVLQIIDGELWLAPRVAAIAAASVGEENTATTAANDAEKWIERVILANRGRAPQLAGGSVRP